MTSRQAKIQKDRHFRIMRILRDNPDLTQRELVNKLGVSVGGLNYCLNALIDKGFVKMANFFKRKMEGYDALKVEIELLRHENNIHKEKNL